jgi:hypothetical protein
MPNALAAVFVSRQSFESGRPTLDIFPPFRIRFLMFHRSKGTQTQSQKPFRLGTSLERQNLLFHCFTLLYRSTVPLPFQ